MKKQDKKKLIPIFIVFFVLLALFIAGKPLIEEQILRLVKLESQKYKELKKIEIKRINLGLLPPRIEVIDVHVQLNKIEEAPQASIKKLIFYPKLTNLFSAQLKLKRIKTYGLELEIFDSSKKKPAQEFTYNNLRALPLDKIDLINSNIKYKNYNLESEQLSFEKNWNSIVISAQKLFIKDSDKILPPSQVKNLRVFLNSNTSSISNLSFQTKNSRLQAGVILQKKFNTKYLTQKNLKQAKVNLTGKLEISEFNKLIQTHTKKLQNYPLSGSLQVSLYSDKKTKTKDQAYVFNTLWSNFKAGPYFIQNLQAQGTYKNKVLSLGVLKAQDKDFSAFGKRFNLNFNLDKKTAYLDSKINIEKMELGSFLEKNIGLNNIPVYAPLHSLLDCQGEVYPQAQLKCSIKGQTQRLKIWSSKVQRKENIIVDLSKNNFNSEVTLRNKDLEFKTEHKFNKSSASASGLVHYVKGFDIAYEANHIDFSDVNSLANIPLSGNGKLKGTTHGSAHWGIFDIEAELNDLYFFEYYFGNTKASIHYKDSYLSFKDVQAQINSSNVSADLGLNFDGLILDVKAHSKKMRVADILKSIKNIAEVPIYLSGQGDFDLDLHGPLDLGKMTYTLNANFNTGLIYKDRYKDLKISLDSDKGNVDVESSLHYLSDNIDIAGTAQPNGHVDLVAYADSINLANIIFFKELGVNLEGLASLKVEMKDHILLPTVTGHATTSATKSVSQLGASDFDFKIHKTFSEFDGTFFDGKAIGHFKVPHTEKAPMAAKASYRDFNPMALFSMFSQKASQTDAQIKFTGKSDLISYGDLTKNLNGTLQLESLSIGNSKSHTLRATAPSQLKFTQSKIDGRLRLKDNFNNLLKLNFNSKELSHIRGKLNLSFLRSFVPNLEESRGLMYVDSKFKVFPRFSMQGGGRIENLYLRLEGIKHAFQGMNAQFQLKGTQIIFGNIRGELANGSVNGAGYIDLKNGLEVNFSGRTERVNLDLPEGVRTISSGNFSFTGKEFPYTLGGNFDVHEGYFSTEFTGESADSYNIALSPYIPESEREEPPLLLNLKAKSEKPIKVKNTMIDGEANFDLLIQGSPNFPVFTGTVSLVPGTLLLFQDKQFQANSGQVKFDHESPSTAQLNIDAEARITDNSEVLGRDYDVRVVIQGEANDPAIIFSSQPALSEEQILSLIALGVKDSNRLGQELSSDSQESQTGYQLGGIFLRNEFARDLQDRLGVQVNFTSSFEDQDVSPKIIIQKKFNPKFSLTGSRTLGTNKRTSTQLEYKFNKNFSIISGWENYELEDPTLLRTRRFLEENVMGVDLQYSFEFE